MFLLFFLNPRSLPFRDCPLPKSSLPPRAAAPDLLSPFPQGKGLGVRLPAAHLSSCHPERSRRISAKRCSFFSLSVLARSHSAIAPSPRAASPPSAVFPQRHCPPSLKGKGLGVRLPALRKPHLYVILSEA